MTAIQKYALEFTQEQRDLILKMYFGKASPEQSAALLEVAKIRGLNPFLGDVHFVCRKTRDGDVWAIQIGIDGARKLALKTGELDGCSVQVFDDAQGRPFKAVATVRRKGCAQPFEFEARFEEYVQTHADGRPIAMWARMPRRMIAKCAEMGALRMAFADAIGGLYEQDEPVYEEPPRAEPAEIVAGIKSRVAAKADAVRTAATPPERLPPAPVSPPPQPQNEALVEAQAAAQQVVKAVGGQVVMPKRTTGVAYPFGREKGKDLADVSDNSLEFWRKSCVEQLGDESKAKYHASTRRNLGAIDAELAFRGLASEPQMPTEISAEEIPF